MKKSILFVCFIAVWYPLSCLAQYHYTDKEAAAIMKLESKLKADLATDALSGSISALVIKK